MTNLSKLIVTYLAKGSCLLTLALLLSSCLVDEREYTREEELMLRGEEMEMLLPLQLPNSLQAVTRGLTKEEENQVDMLHVLVFDSTDDKYLYFTMTSQVEDAGSLQSKKAKLKLIYGVTEDNLYDLVFLTNATEIINNGAGFSGLTKTEILEKLIYTDSTRLVTPESQSIHPFTPLIMWGENKNVTLTPGENTLDEVALVRMLAKVNVSVALEGTSDKFELTSVHVYNANDRGYVAPLSGWDTQNPKNYTHPHIPAGAGFLVDPLVYREINQQGHCLNEIYLFEAKQGDQDLLSNTCLVIGGKYNNSTQDHYYRLDFVVDTTGVTEYIPLLRNNSYEVKITNVTGEGYPDPGQAFRSAPLNIQAEIVSWNETQMDGIYFDGQYYLTRSSGHIQLAREARSESSSINWDTSNILELKTDYPTGWRIDSIRWHSHVDSIKTKNFNRQKGWLDANLWEEEALKESKVQILVTENTTSLAREGKIYISAGRINCMVAVTQTNLQNLIISITGEDGEDISELVFPGIGTLSYPLEEKEFTVRWAPRELPLEVNSYTIPNKGKFEMDISNSTRPLPTNRENTFTIPAGSGNETYRFVPTPMSLSQDTGMAKNPFFEKELRVEFEISANSTVRSYLFLRQVNYNLVADTKPSYQMDGKKHSFYVRSNVSWTVSLEDDGSKKPGEKKVIEKLITQEGPPDIQRGYLVEFETVNGQNDPDHYFGTAILCFTAVNGEFDPIYIPVNCSVGELQKPANSYLMKPGGTGILIPVSRANEHASGSIGETDAYDVEIVWQDNLNIIKRIIATGQGPESHILVIPGESAEGNAVIAVKVNGVIKWSWHIWVTDYDPTEPGSTTTIAGTTLMNRNLGATASDGSMPGRYGLVYQWGRKDPFPSSSNTTYITPPIAERAIYNATGQPLNITMVGIPVLNGGVTKDASIQRPLDFYTGWHWHLSMNNTEALWGPGINKALYDPCPPGWRVPAATELEFAHTATLGGLSGSGMSITDRYSTTTLNLYYSHFRNGEDGELKATFITSSSTPSSHYWTSDISSGNLRYALGLHTLGSGSQAPYYARVTDEVTIGTPSFFYNSTNGFSIRCVADRSLSD